MSYCDIAHDRRIFDVFAYESPGTCAFRLGHFAESATGYGRAEACEPDEPDPPPTPPGR